MIKRPFAALNPDRGLLHHPKIPLNDRPEKVRPPFRGTGIGCAQLTEIVLTLEAGKGVHPFLLPQRKEQFQTVLRQFGENGVELFAHILCGEKLTPQEVVLCAAHAEDVTSGGFHADNVAPCVLGGFTVIRSYEPFEVVSIQPPEDLGIVVAMPDVMVPTRESRMVLPHEVPVKDMVFHLGNAACMVYGMQTGDLGLIGRSVQDAVFEPARTPLVPHLKKAEAVAKSHGAIASFLGGSGPCIISFYDKSSHQGESIAESIKALYAENEMKCDTWITEPGSGCRRI